MPSFPTQGSNLGTASRTMTDLLVPRTIYLRLVTISEQNPDESGRHQGLEGREVDRCLGHGRVRGVDIWGGDGWMVREWG